MSKYKLTLAATTYKEFGGGILIDWHEEKLGFGQIYIERVNDKLTFSAECMSRAFIKEVLCQLIDESDIT